jgi:hypothetical protein
MTTSQEGTTKTKQNHKKITLLLIIADILFARYYKHMLI